MTKAQRDIRKKLRVLQYAADIGNIAKTCRYFGISRETFYVWQRTLATQGEAGLVNKKPCPENPSLRTPPAFLVLLGYFFGQTVSRKSESNEWYFQPAQTHCQANLPVPSLITEPAKAAYIICVSETRTYDGNGT